MADLTTAGVKVYYGVAVTRPTALTGYTPITGIKSIPDLNPEPSSHETTELAETEWKTYIPGLMDVGGSLAFKANHTDAFVTVWETLVGAYAAGMAETTPETTWFAIVIPGLTKSFYFSGEPVGLGLSAIEVDAVLEIDAHIVPDSIVGWAAAPTTI